MGAGWGLPATPLSIPPHGQQSNGASPAAGCGDGCQRCVPCPECCWQQSGSGMPRSWWWDRLTGACGCTWLWLHLGECLPNREQQEGEWLQNSQSTGGGQHQNPEAVGK